MADLLRPVVYLLGWLLMILAAVMLVPLLMDIATHQEVWTEFFLAAVVSVFVGGLLAFTFSMPLRPLSIRQAFLLTTLSWIVLAIFAGLPFMFEPLSLSFVDAFFESMSAITTTGSTVITGLDSLPPSLLLWRALLQWLGGMGIVVIAILVLPVLQVGGMQIFRLESSDKSEKFLPRMRQIAGGIIWVYTGLTAACTIFLWVSGLSFFDSMTHAMCALSTGGFSTRDASVGGFQNPMAEWVLTFFMVLAGLPILLYLKAAHGDWRALWRDSQVRTFVGILCGFIALLSFSHLTRNTANWEEGFRHVAFNIVSVISGTGFTTTDYSLWGPFAIVIIFFGLFFGGCAGSTTCGIKTFRLQILYATTKAQLQQLLLPRGVFVPLYQGRPVSQEIAIAVMNFFFIYALSFAILTIGLGFMELDWLTSASAVAANLSNVGPGLGPIVGPSGNYVPLPDFAKILLTFGMLLGRLEFLTVLVLFSPGFWRES